MYVLEASSVIPLASISDCSKSTNDAILPLTESVIVLFTIDAFSNSHLLEMEPIFPPGIPLLPPAIQYLPL